jgi:hypothetical protein
LGAVNPNSAAADGVGQLHPVAHQAIAHSRQHQRGLLLGGLHWHEAHGRPAHRLALRRRIG